MELTTEMRAECDSWLQYLREHGTALSPAKFDKITEHISAIERAEKSEKMDKESFQKEVDDEEAEKKADKPKDRVYAPSKDIRSFVDLLETASVLRYSPPSGFKNMEPGKGHTAGDMFPGTEPVSPVHGEMYQVKDNTYGVGDGEIGDGPEAHQTDQGAKGGSNVTLEVWPQGFVNVLIGNKPSGEASVGGLVMGGRAEKSEKIKIKDGDGDEDDKDKEREYAVVPYRVVLDADGIRSLIGLADQGLEYRRQLELDGVRYCVAKDREYANPDMHMRIMRSISDINDLKDYVTSLRRGAEESFFAKPIEDKALSDFMKATAPIRQTQAPAAGLGTREFRTSDSENKEATRSLLDNPAMYKA